MGRSVTKDLPENRFVALGLAEPQQLAGFRALISWHSPTALAVALFARPIHPEETHE